MGTTVKAHPITHIAFPLLYYCLGSVSTYLQSLLLSPAQQLADTSIHKSLAVVPIPLEVYDVLTEVSPLISMSDGWWLWRLKEDRTWLQRKEMSFVSKGCRLKKITDLFIKTQIKWKIKPLCFSLPWLALQCILWLRPLIVFPY